MSTPPAMKDTGGLSAVTPLDDTSPARVGIVRDLLHGEILAEAIRSVPAGERTDEQHTELRQTDAANAGMLRRVLAEHGWPAITLVGAEAARAAWLIALRSDDAEFQHAVLQALAEAVAAGRRSPPGGPTSTTGAAR